MRPRRHFRCPPSGACRSGSAPFRLWTVRAVRARRVASSFHPPPRSFALIVVLPLFSAGARGGRGWNSAQSGTHLYRTFNGRGLSELTGCTSLAHQHMADVVISFTPSTRTSDEQGCRDCSSRLAEFG